MESKTGNSYDLPAADLPSKRDSIASANVETAAGSTDQLVERGNWGNPIEFILACMNYALGLGNVWRFPYLAYRNGGGAFLVPYLLMVFVVGLPIFFCELFLGQYSGLGAIKVFTFIAPVFRGLGYCALLTTAFVSIYYMVIIAWVIFYMWTSFFPSLIWGACDQAWNNENCYSMNEDIKCRVADSNYIFRNLSCRSVELICQENSLSWGGSRDHCLNNLNQQIPLSDVITRTLAAEQFFYDRVVGINNATWTSDWGWPQGHLVLCLFLAWFVAFFCVFKGVKSVGKIVYFTATFPYIVLTALLIRALTLEGAVDGIWFFIEPEWDRLLLPGVWGDATSQVFFSFSLAWGALIVLASYNKFSNNCHFDAVTVSLINFSTAIYNGIVVFAILGFLSNSMGVPVDEVASSGPGLTFITYPEAVLLMPAPQVWAILFFFMMLVLGLGSQFGSIQMVQTSIIDQWPHLRENEWRVTAGICICFFLAAIPMTSPGGIYLQTLMEWHTASWNIFLIGFGFVITVSWVYGIEKTFDNIQEMGMKLMRATKWYWRSVWVVITPLALVAIFIFILTDLSPTQFRGYVFPWWADLIGYLFGFATLVPFITFGIIELLKVKKGEKTFRDLITPTENWGPQEVDGRVVDRAQMN